MKWYKRFSSFSSTPEVFRISPMAHLLHNVICDMTAGFDCDGLLPAKYIDDCEYLAHKLHMRLIPEHEYEAMKTSNLDIGLLNVTHRALLSRCVQQLCDAGLLSPDICDGEKVYKVPGFTSDNVAYLSDSTVRQRKHREKMEKNVTHAALPSRTVTQSALVSRLEEKRREEKEDKENIVAVATSRKLKKSKPTESDETKERRKSLLAKAAALFSSVRGQPYVHQGAKDNVALKSIMAHSDDSEILRRFEAGLRLDRWPRIDSIAQLKANWNSLATLPVQTAKVQNLTFAAQEQVEREKRKEAEREKQKRLEAKLEADRKVEWWEPMERGSKVWNLWLARQQELEAAGEFEKLAPTYERKKG